MSMKPYFNNKITYMKSVRNELQRRSGREYNVGWKVVDYASMWSKFLRALAIDPKSAGSSSTFIGISQSAGGIGTFSGLGGEVNLEKNI